MLAEIGKILVIVGVGIIVLGGLLWLSSGTLKNFPLGRLPGDIVIQKDNFTFYFPLVTCVVLSIILSAVIWLWQLISR
ncbi:DUF2905 domain-containing protein [Mastigocoleus sp. MO_188.B34]|uniref:DUF2905 domain-containing protein n=1 Tax=Mastigocoleus sp. MO_188.B34 TaxID=3036635 RepID=UPI002609FE3E|nr:DUF2905 domain-containing protein [Mastigocoleus sp. MO_188.B34]MDJ0697426.1 DUF2905 domain-containing protein [Mastigocoleus sp. MO_188.B34]